MTVTVRELQEWLDVHYPDEYQFPSMLSYWLNKYTVETRREAKRLSHQNHKDFIRSTQDE